MQIKYNEKGNVSTAPFIILDITILMELLHDSKEIWDRRSSQTRKNIIFQCVTVCVSSLVVRFLSLTHISHKKLMLRTWKNEVLRLLY